MITKNLVSCLRAVSVIVYIILLFFLKICAYFSVLFYKKKWYTNLIIYVFVVEVLHL